MADKHRHRLYVLVESFYRGRLVEDYFEDSPRRKFHRKLYFETFRHLGFIENCLSKFLRKNPGPKTRAALAVGCAQIFFMDEVPDYAAVSESVDFLSGPHRGFCNAVLRNVIREKEELLAAYNKYQDFPEWLIDDWKEQYKAKLDFFECMNETPDFYMLDTETLDIVPADDKKQNQSRYRFMDRASSLIPHLAGSTSGLKILDCCAAPGGKTFILSKKFPEGHIFAVEKNEKRARDLEKFIKREKLKNVSPLCGDVMYLEADADFDLILLDAPCSALGTIRKHPEVRWLRSREDVINNGRYQLEMLKRTSEFLAGDGRLIYSVCSLQKQETFDVIDSFMKENEGFELVKPECPDEFLHGDYFLSKPCETGCDGFFAAVIRRTS